MGHFPRAILMLATILISGIVLSCAGEGGGETGAGGSGPGGATGAAGDTGTAGSTGAAGTTGIAGATGSAGTTGVAGATGSAGATGVAGATGTAGSGTPGSAGSTGAAGTTGLAGRGGTTGAAGATGGGGTTGRGGRGGTTGSAGRGGTTGSAGSGAAGSGAAGAGVAGSTGSGGATPSTGCGKTPPASARYSIDVSGTMREYILAVPTNYNPNTPYRLVFAWHPLGGSAQSTAGSGNSGYYGLRGASNNQAILVSPEGLQQSMGRGWWNTGGGDIAFMRAMLERFKTEMCIDEGRIFSTGFSFGGMMSFAVGCAGLARAIAPMAGNTQVSGCTSGTTRVAVMGFHGDDDTVVAISGGRTGRDAFVQRNGCTQQTMPATPNWCDGVSQSNQPCTCVSYQGCTAGYPVTWCEFNGPHTPAPNSAATIWTFFSQF